MNGNRSKWEEGEGEEGQAVLEAECGGKRAAAVADAVSRGLVTLHR